MTRASLQSARNRLKSFPTLAASCSKEGTLYAMCVTRKHEMIDHMSCQEEFQKFRQCLQNAASKLKTRI